MHINFEFKARTQSLATMEKLLQQHNPRFVGTDQQSDTYFTVPFGRLKLREGNIENALIHYDRKNVAGAKQSDVILYQHEPDAALKQILSKALGIKAVIVKTRNIYFIDNVKFHFDTVQDLGTFIEVEAIDTTGTVPVDKLRQQCTYYAQLFGIQEQDYVAKSYSDLLLASS